MHDFKIRIINRTFIFTQTHRGSTCNKYVPCSKINRSTLYDTISKLKHFILMHFTLYYMICIIVVLLIPIEQIRKHMYAKFNHVYSQLFSSTKTLKNNLTFLSSKYIFK